MCNDLSIPTRLLTGLLLFLLAACNGSQMDSRRITVLAYDVCLVDLPVRNLTVTYNDDSAAGSATYSINGSKQIPLDFYIGNYPDTSSFIEKSMIPIANPDAISVAKQRYRDGSFVIELKLKESAFHQDTVALRSTERPAAEQELLAFAERIRRCRIR